MNDILVFIVGGLAMVILITLAWNWNRPIWCVVEQIERKTTETYGGIMIDTISLVIREVGGGMYRKVEDVSLDASIGDKVLYHKGAIIEVKRKNP